MSAPLGPVSAALEADLRDWARRHGIVIWLDVDGHYSAFVDKLIALRESGSLTYDVRAFRGSYLELMLSLETLAGGSDKAHLVVHLPGHTEETVRDTPLLELYFAGARYRKSFATLITDAAAGSVRPEQIAAFLAQGEPSLAVADTWLAALLDEDAGSLTAQLRAFTIPALIDDLLSGGFVSGHTKTAEGLNAIWNRLAAGIGLTTAWRDACLPADKLRPEDVAFAAAHWALCVEFVDDLRRPPLDAEMGELRALPRPLINVCRELAKHLRDRHSTFYQQTADETEQGLGTEVENARAEDLGACDTFRFEEDLLLQAALAALRDQRWDSAQELASGRLNGNSFWLRDNPSRHSAWQMVSDAARLGQALVAAGPSLGSLNSLEAAIERYVERGAAVDRAHRHLEQRRLALVYVQLPKWETQLRACLDGLRSLWRDWADAWARDFNAVCQAHGFLPAAALQQRTLFDEVVRPLTQDPGTTALFVVDSLRFEMGEELFRGLSDTPATTTHLRARLAELPTVTAVGMNVLAPVAAGGRLRPVLADGRLEGFVCSTGEYRVSDPDSRKRAMHDRVGGGTCPAMSLTEVLEREATSLKQAVARARLVIVHSREIDEAGEKGAGPAVFDQVLQKLRTAWRLLRDAGVQRFVFTADHGFLMLDETARDAQPHGRKIDPKRRHFFSTAAADHAGEVRVPLANLGYEGVEGHLMFPDSTAVFDTGRRSMSFVHGGNSLQERVIPVLTLLHRAPAGGSTLQYVVVAKARDSVAGMLCLEAKAEVAAQMGLDFGGSRELELGLRVPDAPEVQVDVCQARGGARLEAGVIVATVGESFELFFRLTGTIDARVLVELYHPGGMADVTPCVVDGRFAVTVARTGVVEPVVLKPLRERQDWLNQFTEAGLRQLFEHLAVHGAVTEAEAASMLGGQRALRRFSVRFEELAKQAPFGVRIDVVSGVKRYVREGASS